MLFVICFSCTYEEGLFAEINADVEAKQGFQPQRQSEPKSQQDRLEPSEKLEFDTKTSTVESSASQSDYIKLLSEESSTGKDLNKKKDEPIGIDLENNIYLQVSFLLAI